MDWSEALAYTQILNNLDDWAIYHEHAKVFDLREK